MCQLPSSNGTDVTDGSIVTVTGVAADSAGGAWTMVVAKVTVWEMTWVATDAGELEAEAVIVDSMVAVCTCVIASVTVFVAGGADGAGVELPPSTATTEYDCG